VSHNTQVITEFKEKRPRAWRHFYLWVHDSLSKEPALIMPSKYSAGEQWAMFRDNVDVIAEEDVNWEFFLLVCILVSSNRDLAEYLCAS
jgi:hypothetical protein